MLVHCDLESCQKIKGFKHKTAELKILILIYFQLCVKLSGHNYQYFVIIYLHCSVNTTQKQHMLLEFEKGSSITEVQ